MAQRYFTLEEANALLPRLRELLPRALELARRHNEAEARVLEYTERMKSNGRPLERELNEARQELASVEVELNRALSEVHELGCKVKDLRVGLVDFPAEMDGREVYLCWKLDEGDIAWWHEVEGGFAGRQPLEPR
jgi:hypothetical protein